MTSYLFNGFDVIALPVIALFGAYAFRLIPTIRITITKEAQDD